MKKRILVAPLNWGLGHATRCIPIINALIEQNFEPVIASDGDAFLLLKKEFPALTAIELPSYRINYSLKGEAFKLKLIRDSPKIIRAINKEHKQINHIIDSLTIDGIISDNRFGVYNKQLPSIYISHQMTVLSGSTTWFSTKLHERFIKKFDECWVPDKEGELSLSGRLGHLKKHIIPTRYLGVISRFNKSNEPILYDLLILLSGPEPQRTLLEKQLFEKLEYFKGSVLFVRGRIASRQQKRVEKQFTIVNFMESRELEMAMNQSDLVVSRSGYTTLLDLAKLNKKAFFIPTPGQFEQEYLARRLDEKGIAPFCEQDGFHIDQLSRVSNYKGFRNFNCHFNPNGLFTLFKSE